MSMRTWGWAAAVAAWACLPAAAAAQGGRRPTTRPFEAGAAYATASAHDPHYAERSVWPEWVERSAFAKEQWPKARVLVWAHAGKLVRRVELSEAGNWLEAGRPAGSGPDRTTDVVFPAGAKVSGNGAFEARHVTVAGEASVSATDANVYGNLWVKQGGKFSRGKGFFGSWDKSTFCRSDNDGAHFIPNMLVHNKRKDVSTEWIGKWQTGDEVTVFSGRFIVAPDSTFMPTDRREFRVFSDGELVLLSGATFCTRGNCYAGNDIELNGALLAGTPERPLRRDCTLGLSFKSKPKQQNRKGKPDDRGLVLSDKGRIAVCSADPKTARLVFKWHRRPNQTKPFKDGEPPEVVALPHGIDMVLMGRVDFDGVEFNDVLKGGILLPDPAARKGWKNVTFGKGNFGSEAELFARYTGRVELKDGGGRGVRAPAGSRSTADEGTDEP